MPDTPTAAPNPLCVPALGSRRRLRALTAAGWPMRAIASATKTSNRTLITIRAGGRDFVHRDIADRLADVYDVAASTTPQRALPDTAAARAAITETLRYAATAGWTDTPTAWEGLDLDDPKATTATEPRTVRAHQVRGSVSASELLDLLEAGDRPERLGKLWPNLSFADRRQVVATLRGRGMTAAPIGKRLGIPERAVYRSYETAATRLADTG